MHCASQAFDEIATGLSLHGCSQQKTVLQKIPNVFDGVEIRGALRMVFQSSEASFFLRLQVARLMKKTFEILNQ